MPATDEGAAAAHAVRKLYPGGAVALDHVEVTVPRGVVTALIGNNGSGKTTFLKIIAGLLPPTSGSVRVLGVDAVAHPEDLREDVGYVAQSVELDPEMTGLETLTLFATLYGLPRAAQCPLIREFSTRFGLDAHLRRRVAAYSGGLRQRLHLAVSMLHDPELLVLDEPTAALDPSGRAFMWDLLRDLCDRGHSVIVATHDLGDVERHCDRVIFLHQGRVVADGSPREVIDAGGAWSLRLSAAMSATVEERLHSLDGVGFVRRNDGEWSIELTATAAERAHAVKEEVLGTLADSGVETTAFELRPPDLSSAYFSLAHAPLVAPEPPDRHRGGRRGIREGAGV